MAKAKALWTSNDPAAWEAVLSSYTDTVAAHPNEKVVQSNRCDRH